MDLQRSEIVGKLHENVCLAEFEKSDGTIRIMECTLKDELLPIRNEDQQTTKKPAKPIIENVVVCFDVEANGWRSFKIDKLKSFEVKV